MLSGGASCPFAYPVNPTKTSKGAIMKRGVLLNDIQITFVKVNLFESLLPKNNFKNYESDQRPHILLQILVPKNNFESEVQFYRGKLPNWEQKSIFQVL